MVRLHGDEGDGRYLQDVTSRGLRPRASWKPRGERGDDKDAATSNTPFPLGGLGLRSHSRIRHVPFLAATAQVMRELKDRVKSLEDPGWLEESWIGTELKASSEQLREVQGTRALLPGEDGEFVDFYCNRPHRHSRLQRQLTRKVEDAAGRQWSASNPPTEEREKLRRDFLKQPGAKDVFTAIPAEGSWSLPIRGAAWRTAVAMWLGLPHGKLMVEECQGKHTSCQRSGKEWDHYQSCLRPQCNQVGVTTAEQGGGGGVYRRVRCAP